MNRRLKVGIIGDLDSQSRFHQATNEALRQAAAALSAPVEPVWLPTDSLAEESSGARLADFDALWCGPGSPYRSMDGALKAVKFAREQGRPFVGT
ncbi:MAG: hypothetical protein AB1641_25045 [Thermodesulfobacteriota bacterium]